eukprot:COSAG01_NODE_273_length_19739_cov_90.981925_13_plen_79_part_00
MLAVLLRCQLLGVGGGSGDGDSRFSTCLLPRPARHDVLRVVPERIPCVDEPVARERGGIGSHEEASAPQVNEQAGSRR